MRTLIQLLIVDDHPMVGLGTKNILEEVTDYNITYLSNWQQVIQDIKKKTFDLYLLDINMPNCSGIELSKKSYLPIRMLKSYSIRDLIIPVS